MLIWFIIISTFAISLLGWIGLITSLLNKEALRRVLFFLISFAAGTLMGGAFLHLLLESLSENGIQLSIFIYLLAGFSLFFLIEQILHWHHNHFIFSGLKHKPVTYMILIADGLHNFIGGMAIGGSFIIDIKAGLLTALIEAVHEIPQELGDFGILIYGGWKTKKALIANFISALTIVPGGILSYFFSDIFNTAILLPFAAGNFLYIAASDLIPEIKEDENAPNGFILYTAFLSGVSFILLLKLIEF